MCKIILTVQPAGNNKYRLGINTKDSRNIFKKRKVPVMIKLDENLLICTKTTCGCKDMEHDCYVRKKGYDLYHRKISEWINQKGFKDYIPRQPTKLVFKYSLPTTTNKDYIFLEFVEKSK